MRKIWLILALCCVALLFCTASYRTKAQAGGCFGGVVSLPANIQSATPILKLGKFAPPSGSQPMPFSVNARRSENGDASYNGGDVANNASFPNCNLAVYQPNVPRIAGPFPFPKITNANDMRFIIAAEERVDDDGDGQNESSQLESLTLKFYEIDCFMPGPVQFATFNIPVSNCTLVSGYYVFSLTSQQAFDLQSHLDRANNSNGSNMHVVYVGATMTVSRDDQFNTETNAGEILYVGNNSATTCGPMSLNSTGKVFEGNGGSGAFDVASDGCLWRVTNVPSWITLNSGQFGNGNGMVSYSLQPNTTGAPRSASLTVSNGVNSQAYSITQTCNTLSPAAQLFGENGGNSTINLTSQVPGCSWTATENLTWVNITSGASGTSPGAIAYTVSPNTQANASGRAGVINISEFDFEVKQAGPGGDCATLPITFGQSIPGTLSSGDCPSTTLSTRPADRYSFTGTAGQRISISLGNAFVNAAFSLLSSAGSVLTSSLEPLELPYTGIYTIEIYSSTSNTFGSYTLSLCSYTLSSDEIVISPFNEGEHCVQVIEQGSCAYSASEAIQWIILPTANYSGSDSVCVIAQDNIESFPRRGIITVAGKTVVVKQPPTAVTLVVNNPLDAGDGSLRDAISLANIFSRSVKITFNLPGPGPHTISPATPLPPLTNTILIDGTTQPGYAGKPIIELNGSGAGFADGLEIVAQGCQVRGLVINRFQGNGIRMNCDDGTIKNCYIGTDLSGSFDQGNAADGIRVAGYRNHIQGNLISGNDVSGVILGFEDNRVLNNLIGTNAMGTGAIGNGSYGIFIFGNRTTIGDGTPGAGNTIAFNGGAGVYAFSSSSNSIRGNSIYSNGELGVDFSGIGVTPNDSGDSDGVQNFPVLTSAVSSGGNTVIQGTLNSQPFQTYRIELFSNNSCDVSGNGEGQAFIGFTEVFTGDSLNASFSLTVPTNSINGSYITATAAKISDGGTSEFSACVFVVDPSCSYNIAPMSQSFAAAGGNGTVTVTASAGCNWNASTNNPDFLTITSGNSGTGNGTVQFTVAGNGNPTSRNGTLTIANQTFTVTQAASVPILGNYANASVALSSNATITPDAAPTGTVSATATASTNFKGELEIDPTTGIVRATNAHPAGSYTVTVIAFNSIAVTTTSTFTLTVTTPAPCDVFGATAFAAAANLAVGLDPFSVAVGDFNGDGKQDIVSSNENTDNVSVLLRNAANTGFGPKVDFTVGDGPYFVAVGDINGDGKQDIATANYNANTVSVLLRNAANTSFDPKIDFAVGSNPYSVAVGDFNGDGKQDLVAANINANSVSVLLRNAANTSFDPKVDFAVSSRPISVAVGDVNGDGKPDLATSNLSGNSVSVLLRNAANTGFDPKADFPVGSEPYSVAIGDVNGDGKQDIVAANSAANSVSVLLRNAANTSFDSKIDVTVGVGPLAVALSDANSDGKPDLVVANYGADTVSVLLRNAANNGFDPKTDFAVGLDPRSIAVGDVNGDGKQDLITANSIGNTVSVLQRQCGPTLGNYANMSMALNGNTTIIPDAAPTDSASATVTTTTDFKGELEINPTTGVVRVTNAHPAGGYTATITAFNSGGAATKTFTLTVTTPAPCDLFSATAFAATANSAVGSVPISVAVGDINGDGKQDLVTANQSSASVSVLQRNAANTGFDANVDFAVDPNPRFVAIGDVNGDGRQDLLIANGNGNSVSVLQRNAANTGFDAKVDFAVGTHPASVAVGDVNGDGKQDIVSANENTDNVSVLLRNGANIGFDTKIDFAVGTTPYLVTVCDINGDGKADLITSNHSANSVSVLLRNNANNGFDPKVDFTVGTTPYSVAVGDVNGDGKADLVTSNHSANSVSVLLRNAANTGFDAKVDFAVGVNPISVAVGDVNSDGKQDIITANVNANSVSVLLRNAANTGFDPKIDFAVGSGSRFVAIADVNGDGKADLVTTNQSSANVSVLLRQCAPTVTAVAPLTRQQGSAASNSQIAMVNDADQAANTLMVAATPLTGTGVTLSSLSVDAAGNVTANVAVSCTATTSTFTLTVTDNTSRTATATLTVNVTANIAPTLGNYATTSVNAGTSSTVTPDAAPTDNGMIASLNATASPNTFTGTLSVNTSTGVVTISNAAPPGSFTITVTATDNCGATSSKTFTLNVNAPPTISAQSGISRQQGSPASNSTIATVSDTDSGAASLTVTVTSVNPSNGVILSSIVNSAGTVTADLIASCTATNASFTLRVTDSGGLFNEATLTVTVNPSPAPAISPANQSFTANGGSGTVNVTSSSGCPWTAVSNDGWIIITSGSGTGNGSVSYTVAAHSNASNRTGTITVAGQTFTIFQGAAFLDVPLNHPFYTEIGKLSARGVTLGCGGGNYCPDQAVTREQMAAFIMRALGEPNPPTPGSQRFLDVPPSNPFYNFVDRLAELQITLGCGGGNYCPAAPVLREQMAAFLIRALHEPGYIPPTPASQRFNDVPPSNPFYGHIEEMAMRQITLGCSASPPLYCPGQTVTRGQMAAFLVRAFGL